MAMSMMTLTIKGYHQTPRLPRSLLHPAVCPWLATKSKKCPCAAAKLSTDAKEEGVSRMNLLYGSDWSPQAKAWNEKGFNLPEIILMNLIVRKLRIKKKKQKKQDW